MDFSQFDILTIGILAVDRKLRIFYINEAYAEFLGREPMSLLGTNVRDVLPHTGLDKVIHTGKAERGVCQVTSQGYLFGNRVPIFEDGQVVGALAELVLQSTQELDELNDKLIDMDKKIKYLTHQLMSTAPGKTVPLIYQSEPMRAIVEMAQKVAPLDTTVLITGETGTGKELIADLLYHRSGRDKKPMVKINCAALPTELIESELFGYDKGAFTGANTAGQAGLFEQADGGVLFLDEISSMPLAMQSKLLRVLQDKEVVRLGGRTKRTVDVKIIAATNEKLDELVHQNKFREDLFYRLNVVNLDLPPLRERPDDILLLSNHFLDHYFDKFSKKRIPLSYSAAKMIENYLWPGNVRELKNAMERLAIMCDHVRIEQSDILEYTSIRTGESACGTLKEQMDNYERQIIMDSLGRSGGNRSTTAKELGLNRTTLYSKMNKYHLDSY